MNYDLGRFKKAQEIDYHIALAEMKSGHKQSHWIWYIFPQLDGLGYSSTAKFYGIKNRDEAVAYIDDDILRTRLVEISNVLLGLECDDPTEVMGYPDNLKLKSCMTLFDEVAPNIRVFQNVLDKFYKGEKDEKTLMLLKE